MPAAEGTEPQTDGKWRAVRFRSSGCSQRQGWITRSSWLYWESATEAPFVAANFLLHSPKHNCWFSIFFGEGYLLSPLFIPLSVHRFACFGLFLIQSSAYRCEVDGRNIFGRDLHRNVTYKCRLPLTVIAVMALRPFAFVLLCAKGIWCLFFITFNNHFPPKTYTDHPIYKFLLHTSILKMQLCTMGISPN